MWISTVLGPAETGLQIRRVGLTDSDSVGSRRFTRIRRSNSRQTAQNRGGTDESEGPVSHELVHK